MSEIFGPTVQGEGPSIGRRCSFLRVGGCNLRCRWCDTAYTWDWSGVNGTTYDPHAELRTLTAGEAFGELKKHGTDLLVVSGGEPMMQQRALVPLLEMAMSAGWNVEVETAGTVAPASEVVDLVSQFNVSPKLANSGNHRERRYIPGVLDEFQATRKAVWKFVAVAVADLNEIEALVGQHLLSPVFVMPEGTTAESLAERSRALIGPVIERGWNFTTRLHVLLYGGVRGH